MRPPKPLVSALAANGIIATDNGWNAMHGGRTNRVWRVETATGTLVCKLFDPAADNPLYPNIPQAEFEVLKTMSGQNIAPESIMQISTEAGKVLVYKYVEGQHWRNGCQDVAALLAKIHAQPVTLQLRKVPSGSRALIQQVQRILEQCQNAQGKVPHSFHDPGIAPASKLVLVHTDVVPNNIIKTAQGLRLIDWQCPGFGDPCEDIASFLSPSMQHLYGAAPLPFNQVELFLAAYDAPEIVARYRHLAPLFNWRAAAYCLWKSERGNPDYTRAMVLELSALQESRGQYDKAGQNNANTDIA